MQANVYVQFGTHEALLNGLTLNNQLYKDRIIRAKVVDRLSDDDDDEVIQQSPEQTDDKAEIYVTGLNGQLADLQDEDLRILFKSFGDIIDIQVLVNKPVKQAYAVITFKKREDARMAVEAMHGFKFNNQLLSIALTA